MVAKRSSLIIGALAATLFAVANAYAHAFLDHAEPGVGTTVATAPAKIVLYFTGELEPAFSGCLLQDAEGRELARSQASAEEDLTQLSITPPHLAAGSYRVLWSVVARDGHQTEGDYTFTLQ